MRPVIAPRKTWLWKLRRRWEALRPLATTLAALAGTAILFVGVVAAYFIFQYVTAERRHELLAGRVVATSNPDVAPFVLVRVRGKVLRVEGADRADCEIGDRVDFRRTTIEMRSRRGGWEIIRWKPLTGCLSGGADDRRLHPPPAPAWSGE